MYQRRRPKILGVLIQFLFDFRRKSSIFNSVCMKYFPNFRLRRTYMDRPAPSPPKRGGPPRGGPPTSWTKRGAPPGPGGLPRGGPSGTLSPPPLFFFVTKQGGAFLLTGAFLSYTPQIFFAPSARFIWKYIGLCVIWTSCWTSTAGGGKF